MLVVAAVNTATPPIVAATRLAGIAATDEVAAVCAYDMAASLLSNLRRARRRIRVVAVVADPPTATEADVVESIFDDGMVPVLVTAPERIEAVATWLTTRMGGALRLTLDPELTVAVV
jgi:hypothetical protein